MNEELDRFSTEVDGQRYMKPEVAANEYDRFVDNLRSVQAQQNTENRQTLDNLGSYPASQSNLGGLGGSESTWIDKYQTTPTNSLVSNLRATAQAQALNTVLENEVNYLKNKYQALYRSKRKAANGGGGGGNNSTDPNSSTWDGSVSKEELETKKDFYGVPGTIMSETDTHYIYTDPKTGEQTKVSKDYMNKIYDENGNITDDGAVILDTRRMLGM